MDNYVIVLDLDGTLLNSNQIISNFNKTIIKKCKEIGCKIVINTSRNYNRSISYKKEINADYLICFNGNVIVKDNIIYENKINKERFNKITKFLNSNNFSFTIEYFNKSYRNFKNDKFQFETEFINDLDMISKDCIKILIKSSKEEMNYIKEKLCNLDLNFSYDNINNLLRINASGNNKWEALKKILKSEEKLISFGDDSNDLEILNHSFIGIKMSNSDKSLEEISFTTDSNDNDGVGKFLSNYFNFDLKTVHENIKILDCTLRDGGHLNNSKFGYENIKSIIKKLIQANIDIIELGFLEDCIYKKDVARFDNVSQVNEIISHLKYKNTVFSLLMQADKYDIKKLEKCNSNVKMIRISFHNDIIDKGISYCKSVKEKGYLCSCNPINFSGYSTKETIELIKKVNKINPDYFTIVDTFGSMLNSDFINRLQLLNNTLNKNIKLGLHLHNNLSLSFSTALMLMNENSRFDEVIIDTSILGMGRSPGNLKTELLAYYINKHNSGKYKMKYIYSLMEDEILKFKKQYNWDINYIYSLASFEKIHRSYAEFLINKNVSIEQSELLLKKIPENKKGRYNEKLILEIYNKYVKHQKY